MARRAERTVAAASERAPALALLEVNSIARGVFCVDAMVKRAPVELLMSRTVSPGKHLTLLAGEVAPVEEAMAAGVAAAGAALVDRLLLPYAHAALAPAIGGLVLPGPLAAVAIIETFTVAATLQAADAACKAAEDGLVEMRLAQGLGGKAFFTLSGDLTDLEAAVAAAVAAIDPGLLLGREVIAAPHDDLREKLLF